MAALPPWLDITPQTFLGAMESGTRAGEAARAQDIASSEAADRLRLAYDSLASHERMQNQTAQARAAQAKAAMDLRAAQLQGLQDYRQSQLGLAQQRNEAVLQRNADLISHWKDLQAAGTTREQRLQEKEDRLNAQKGASASQLNSIYKTLAAEHLKDEAGRTAYQERLSGNATPENQAAAMKWKQDEDKLGALKKSLVQAASTLNPAQVLPRTVSTGQAGAALAPTPPAATLTPTTQTGTGDMESQARAAIKAGADEAAVRKRFKEMTGRDLD